MSASATPRGRHAPPPEQRAERDLERCKDAFRSLLDGGWSAREITAERVCGAATLSKSTFYELFGNVGELREQVRGDLAAQVPVSPAQQLRSVAADAGVLLSTRDAGKISAALHRLGWQFAEPDWHARAAEAAST